MPAFRNEVASSEAKGGGTGLGYWVTDPLKASAPLVSALASPGPQPSGPTWRSHSYTLLAFWVILPEGFLLQKCHFTLSPSGSSQPTRKGGAAWVCPRTPGSLWDGVNTQKPPWKQLVREHTLPFLASSLPRPVSWNRPTWLQPSPDLRVCWDDEGTRQGKEDVG